MIFNKGQSLNKGSFRYGADELGNVKSYKYLGLEGFQWELKPNVGTLGSGSP